MNCLILVSHPSQISLTSKLVNSFTEGLLEANHNVNLFYTGGFDTPLLSLDVLRENVKQSDAIVFAFPWWWEMPPYPLVEIIQKVFVKDFAFVHDGNHKKQTLLNLKAKLLICAGQEKPTINLDNLNEAMAYCGLYVGSPSLVFTGCGPNLTEDQLESYHHTARQHGLSF